MLDVLWLFTDNRASRGAPTPGSGARELALSPSTRRAHPADSTPTACSASPLGEVAVDPRSPIVRRLARACVLRHARDNRALASPGLAPVKAFRRCRYTRAGYGAARGGSTGVRPSPGEHGYAC